MLSLYWSRTQVHFLSTRSNYWMHGTDIAPSRARHLFRYRRFLTILLILFFQVNDFPSFLSGEERENTQHLSVEYLTAAPAKGRKGRQSLKSTNGTSSTRSRNGTGPRASISSRRTLDVPLDDISRRASIDAETLRDALHGEGSAGGAKLKGIRVKKLSTSQLPDHSSLPELTDSPRFRSSSVAVPEVRALPLPPSSRRKSRNSDSDLDEKDQPLDRRKSSDPLALSQTTGGDLCLALEKLINEDDVDGGSVASAASRSPGHTPRHGSNSSSRT